MCNFNSYKSNSASHHNFHWHPAVSLVPYVFTDTFSASVSRENFCGAIDWAFSVAGLPFTFLTGRNGEKIHFKSPQTQSSSDKVTLTVSLNDYPLPSKRTIFFDLIVLKTNFDQIGNKTYTMGSTPLLVELPGFSF